MKHHDIKANEGQRSAPSSAKASCEDADHISSKSVVADADEIGHGNRLPVAGRRQCS